MSPTCMVDCGHLVRADPDDQQRQAVHDQHHHRHHDHHDPVDEQAGAGQIQVGLIEALLFEGLHVEGPDDHHAGQVFAGHQVEPVDQVLDDLELGQGDGEDGQDQAQQDDHRQGDDPPHGGALAHRPDHAADADDGRIEDHAHHHDHHHLDLGDIVGGAGDQRGGGEFVELGAGEALHLLEDMPGAGRAPARPPCGPRGKPTTIVQATESRVTAASACRCGGCSWSAACRYPCPGRRTRP